MTKEKFLELTIDEKIEVYNNWCEKQNYTDDFIYFNNLDDILPNATHEEVAQKIYYGNYNFNDDYIIFDGYANLETINSCDIEDFILERMDFEEEE